MALYKVKQKQKTCFKWDSLVSFDSIKITICSQKNYIHGEIVPLTFFVYFSLDQ